MTSAARRSDEDPGRPLTMAEFMAMPEEDAWKIELVRGRIVREPRPKPLHGRAQAIIAQLLLNWVDRTHAGVVLTDTGFVLEHEPLSIRGPDVAYVTHERLPDGAYEAGFWHFGPDLAVEVLSPWNTRAGIREKVEQYFNAGTRLVWIVDPKHRSVTVHDGPHSSHLVEGNDRLDGGEVLPGLTIPLARIFAL